MKKHKKAQIKANCYKCGKDVADMHFTLGYVNGRLELFHTKCLYEKEWKK